MYVVEALPERGPELGASALEALGNRSADLYRVVLPPLLNELAGLGSPLVLVLDDYHLVTNPRATRPSASSSTISRPAIHLAYLSPPTRRCRWPGCGPGGWPGSGSQSWSSPTRRPPSSSTAPWACGWPARRGGAWPSGPRAGRRAVPDRPVGRGRTDATGFIASFHGDNRHVADYLAAEVLARQPEAIRAFLRTSILERLSGPLCDAVLETDGSAGVLAELERSNLFLVPMDDHRQWYRYHHLFMELLRLELAHQEPALVPALHRRAAAWHREAGNLDDAIDHATAAGDHTEAPP